MTSLQKVQDNLIINSIEIIESHCLEHSSPLSLIEAIFFGHTNLEISKFEM